MPKKITKFFKLKFVVLSVLSALMFFCPKASHIALTQTSQEVSSDAVAVRVSANPEHYSALRWYYTQGFGGSPQLITVDDYKAVRDGRTVYINAANISGGSLFTNIYIMSHNQNPEEATVQIFDELLSRWKFNSNLDSAGECSQTSGRNCIYNSDCPEEEYCASSKAQVTRDTKRLAGIAEIQFLLSDYLNSRGHYPKLGAGTYLPSKTLSVWPSWKITLAVELGVSELPIDPLNDLGDCGDSKYNPITCWDEINKEFADANRSDPEINLPADSYAYWYTGNPEGSAYTLCAVMESEYVDTENGVYCVAAP